MTQINLNTIVEPASSSQQNQIQEQRPVTPRPPHYMRRSVAIGYALLREAARFRQFQRLSEENRQTRLDIPQHFVRTLMQLGPTFIKIGQILSTRPDFLPSEYIKELQRLQENVPAFSFQEVHATLETAFGVPLLQLFASFEEQPVASASLSQVHFAVLPDGSLVAVKVQRPGIQETIEEDMVVLGSLLGVLARLVPTRTIRNLNLVRGFQEFRRYTLQELDFVQEAHTMERFQHNFRDSPDVVIPHVHWDHTTSNVLTMSRLSGARLQEVVAQFSPEKRRKINAQVLELEMKMFVADGLFHADLHPGNIFFQEDGKIALLDFGMYGQVNEHQRDHFVLYLLAMVQKEIRHAFYHLLSLMEQPPGANEAAYYLRFKELAEEFYRSTLAQFSFAQVFLQVFLAGSRYGFVVPSDLLLLAKAMTTAEALMFTLVPTMKFEETARPSVIRQYTARVMEFKRLKRTVQQWLPELLMFGELPPAAVRDEVVDDGLSDRLWTEVGQALIQNLQVWKASVDLVPLIVKPFIHKGLKHLYSSETIDDLVDAMKEQYREAEPSIPKETSIGADLTVHLSAFTIAAYRVLVQKGQSGEEATKLIADMIWQIYTKMGEVPWIASDKLGQDGYQRLRFSVDAFLTFPFNSPAYQWEQVDGGEGVCAFNMKRCPVAEYFQAQDLGALCVQTWCNQDFALAKQWGGATLVRAGTLAGGASHCDFRFRAPRAVKEAGRLPATKEAP
jgi:ubiquinone biosynthesis protein